MRRERCATWSCNNIPLRVETQMGYFEYHQLFEYHATVLFPWNWEIITFLEWYGLELPIFVPTRPFFLALTNYGFRHLPERWINLRPEWVTEDGLSICSCRRKSHRSISGICLRIFCCRSRPCIVSSERPRRS